jgi:hypothetical protein
MLALPRADSYVQLNSFDFTLLGVQFTRQDIFQGGQVISHDGVTTNVTASFQVFLPPNSPVQNITFGFGGAGVIGYIDLNGQFGCGSYVIGNMRLHSGTIVSVRRVGSSDALAGQPGIEFPVRDEIIVLQIGARPSRSACTEADDNQDPKFRPAANKGLFLRGDRYRGCP